MCADLHGVHRLTNVLQVKAMSGGPVEDTLSGADFDEKIVGYLVQVLFTIALLLLDIISSILSVRLTLYFQLVVWMVRHRHRKDVSTDKRALRHLRTAVE